MLGFYPEIKLSHNWQNLVTVVRSIADEFIHSGKFMDHLLYQQGASQVASLPNGGWTSKSAHSQDFFVYGGVEELESIGKLFKSRFPLLSFTPPTIGYSSSNVPLHRDHIKNGLTSLIYPIHDNPSLGRVIDPKGQKDFYYLCQKDQMIAINIAEEHMVYVHETRTWFTIHCHEPIEMVKQVFDAAGSIVL